MTTPRPRPQPAHKPAPAPQQPATPPTLKQRLEPLAERLNEKFTDVADWVSSAMGTPVNIVFWFVLVMSWTLIFAVKPSLQNANFLPSWFTSQAYNFPLNLITTVAELFIGFLVAAASNRAERHLRQILDLLIQMLKQVLDIAARVLTAEKRMERMEREHGQMLAELRTLLADLHSHTTCAGHTTIESSDPATPTVTVANGALVGATVNTTAPATTRVDIPTAAPARTRRQPAAKPKARS